MSARNIEAIYALSPQQQGMLFETLSAAEGGVHIEQEIHTLRGDLDPSCFERAWQRVIDRHPALRTAFAWKEQDQPLQVVLQRIHAAPDCQDWRGLTPAEQEQQLDAYLAADRRRGFELSRPPLVRLALFQIGDGAYWLVRTFHHILMDGWCLPVLNREFFAFYTALTQDREASLPPVRPYRDYVAWHKRQDVCQAEPFWRQTLRGFEKPTALGRPDDSPAPSIAEGGYGYHEATLPAAPTAALLSLARRYRVTLNTLVQGAWALLLSRYSGADDIVFGTTVSGRPPELPGVELMIGLFATTLPFRVKVPTAGPLWSWLGEVQARHLELRQYEYCSAGQVHEWSEVPRSLPLFESLLVFENYPADPSLGGASGLRLADVRQARSIGAQTKYALTILAIAGPELLLRAVYDGRRLDQAGVEGIVAHFLGTLAEIAADPEPSLESLRGRIPSGEIPRVRPLWEPGAPREEALVAARTPTEAELTRIWGELLGVREVSTRDNFFVLGGHSLLATQVISRVRLAFQVELPLRCLFEEPTVAGLAQRIDRAQRAVQDGGALPLRPLPRDRPLPLSFAQQRLWVSDQLEPGSPAYNGPAAVRLSGPLDIPALEQSLSEIARRHEALRTTFSAIDGEPVQIIAPPVPLQLPCVDLIGLPEAVREAEASRLAGEEARRPFDLARGPLWRPTLLRLSADEHVLLLTAHHIVIDGWSLAVLFRELGAFYNAFAAPAAAERLEGSRLKVESSDPSKPSTFNLQPGTFNPALPELPIQYADFAVWQREWLQGEVLEQQLSYWKQRLAGCPPLLTLPASGRGSGAPTFRGARHTTAFSPAVTVGLQVLSQQEGCTLFMTLLAAFQTLLHRYTGRDDIVVGTDVANRNRVEIEDLIGFFVNHLVMRTDLSGTPTFRELLRRVREVTLGAYAHQDLPFDKLVEALNPRREPGRTPLFQVLFVHHNTPTHALRLTGLELRHLELDNGTSKFDLALFVEETEQRLVATWVYKTDLFDAARVVRMAAHFETLLGSITAQPDAPIHALEMLTAGEQEEARQGEQERRRSQLRKLRSIRRRSVDVGAV